MTARDKTRLNEVIHHLVSISNALEDVRRRLGDDAGDNLIKGQSYLSESIEYFKIGERMIKKAEHVRILDRQHEDLEEEQQKREEAKQKQLEMQRGDK